MAGTYGSRDKSPFKIPNSDKRYYLLVNDTTGEITVNTSSDTTLIPSLIGGASADRTVGTIQVRGQNANRFIPAADALNEEEQYFISQNGLKATKNHAVITAQKGGATNAQQLIFPSSAVPGTNPQPQPPGQGGNPPVQPTLPTLDGPSSIPIPTSDASNELTPASSASALTYPIKMRTDQDRIKFTAVEYRALGNLQTGQLSSPDRKTAPTIKDSKGSVFLPVQASITDSNSVDWQGAGLNVIERGLANLSGEVMTAKTKEELEGALGKSANAAYNLLQNSKGEIRAYLVGEAVGIQNLLGRFGSVLNPNLELLFTGPQLRPFEFRFQMTAREEKEAKVIKQIINYFKRNMAVKKSDDGTFLRTPNTFFIEYQKGNSKHKSINQIKECALTNCSVDYTPLGTYMTFNDTEATMVSYAMTLSFQELEPIYADDYNDNHSIGY